MSPERAFLSRLLRLDPRALVRRRPDGMWAVLPFRVLVQIPLTPAPTDDATYAAADFIETGEGSDRRDAQWRGALPPSRGRAVETIPVAHVIRLAEAAARTLRTATTEGIFGRPVGERALRDALLDHVAIVVTTEAQERIEIPQRMVQALVRMGLHLDVSGDTMRNGQVTVRLAMGWIGLETGYGSTWYRPISPLHLS